VLGGGNVRKLKTLPPHCRAGNNDNAFRGGFRLWERDNGLPHIAANLAPPWAKRIFPVYG
jgi:polyphosphate glucokinase